MFIIFKKIIKFLFFIVCHPILIVETFLKNGWLLFKEVVFKYLPINNTDIFWLEWWTYFNVSSVQFFIWYIYLLFSRCYEMYAFKNSLHLENNWNYWMKDLFHSLIARILNLIVICIWINWAINTMICCLSSSLSGLY